MATLPSGAPYMLGTDAANTIDTYTSNNANYWDARVPLKTAAGVTGSFSASTTVDLTSYGFTSTPVIILQIKSTSATNNAYVTFSGESSTGFTIYKWKSDGTAASVSTTVHWVAIEL